jgi:uncharacterized iron-regulated protein
MDFTKHVWMSLFLVAIFSLEGCGMLAPRHKLGWQSPYTEVTSLEEGDIIHLPTGVKVSKEQLMNMLASARIVYVGETHDNMNAHQVQLEILKALSERYPGRVAVGMEMLKRPSQKVADEWSSGKLDEKEFVRTWVKDWSNDFEYYRDILQYVREKNTPLLALRAPDDWVERIKKDESALEPGDEGEKLPDMDLEDPYHRAHTEAVFGSHPRGTQSFEDFYKVQVLWDESMAQSIAEYLLTEEGRDKTMVIFAGGQHVEYGFGIPRRVFRRLPLPYAIVLPVAIHISPEKENKLMDVTMPDIPLLPADFAWIVSYQGLEDQKVYLGVMIKETEDGVKILGAMKTSVAEEAGLQKDDVITAFDGEPIKTTFDLTYLIGLKKPGDKGIIEVLRGDVPLRFEVTFRTSHFHM